MFRQPVEDIRISYKYGNEDGEMAYLGEVVVDSMEDSSFSSDLWRTT